MIIFPSFILSNCLFLIPYQPAFYLTNFGWLSMMRRIQEEEKERGSEGRVKHKREAKPCHLRLRVPVPVCKDNEPTS